MDSLPTMRKRKAKAKKGKAKKGECWKCAQKGHCKPQCLKRQNVENEPKEIVLIVSKEMIIEPTKLVP